MPGRMTEGDPMPVLLYDGFCNLCSGLARFVAAHDREGRISCAPLQSPEAEALLLKYGLDTTRMDTVVYIAGGRAYTKSTAVIKIVQDLSGGWRAVGLLLVLPAFLRDRVYEIVGHNRYKWFGQRTSCFLPGNKNRFGIQGNTGIVNALPAASLPQRTAAQEMQKRKPNREELIAMLQTKGWDLVTGSATAPLKDHVAKDRTLEELAKTAHARHKKGEGAGIISKIDNAIELDMFQLEQLWEHLGLPM